MVRLFVWSQLYKFLVFAHNQCDQMARVFVHFGDIYSNDDLASCIRHLQGKFKILSKTN